jgi:hypothetical protein
VGNNACAEQVRSPKGPLEHAGDERVWFSAAYRGAPVRIRRGGGRQGSGEGPAR